MSGPKLRVEVTERSVGWLKHRFGPTSQGVSTITADHLTPPHSPSSTFLCSTGLSQQEIFYFIHILLKWLSSYQTTIKRWGWSGLASGIRVKDSGRPGIKACVCNLLDRENISKREQRQRGREVGGRAREASEVRERSWQELPLGPVPVFQRKCRRPNLWPPEGGGGDWLAPAYCPFYRLLLEMGLSALQTESYHGKRDQQRSRIIRVDFCRHLEGSNY